MSEAGKAVFLSYASQDAEAAKRICEALRAAGVEVWFDQSELRGGDAWDAMIRKRIKDCALFVPVISANTQARAEGYFRLEWKLAVDRSHLMADDAAFLLPVVIGDIADAAARVPDKFREVQWTRLRLDETPAQLATRVARLLSGEGTEDRGQRTEDRQRGHRQRPAWLRYAWAGVGILFALVYVVRPMFQSARVKAAPAAGVSAGTTELARVRARIVPDRWQRQDFEAVSSSLDRIIQANPDEAKAWALLSIINTLQVTRNQDAGTKPLEAGKSAAERALRLAPADPLGELALGMHLVAMVSRGGDVHAPRAHIDRALAGLPTDSLTRYAELVSYWLGFQFEDTDRSARAWLAAEPSASFPAWILAQRHMTTRHPAEAEKWAEQAATDTDVTGVRALATMFDARFYLQADLPAARAALDRQKAGGQTVHRMVFARWLLAMAEHRWDAALQELAHLPESILFDRNFHGPKALLAGLAHRAAGRPEAMAAQLREAERLAREELARDPDNEELHAVLALTLACAGQAGGARAELAAIEPLLSDRAPSVYTGQLICLIAETHAELGEPDQLLPWLRKLFVEPSSLPFTPASVRLNPHFSRVLDAPGVQTLLREFASLDQPPAVAAPQTVALSPARELVEKARVLFQGLEATREDFALAEDYCQRALKLDSTDAEVWAAYAQLNSAFGYRGWDTSAERREQNRVMAERAIRLAPDSAQAKIAQAGAWTTFGINRAETEKLLREVLTAQPGNQPALRFLAVTMLNQDKLDECLALNERSAALPGGDPLALFNSARYLWQRSREAEAYAVLQRSLAQKSFSGSLIFKALMEIVWRGDPTAAEATLRQIPQSEMLEDRANYTAGLVYYYQRRADAALAVWGAFPRDFYADFAYDGPKGLLLGRAHELDHRDAAARIEWRTALQLVEKRIAAAPNKSALYYYQASLLACLGEKAAAEEALHTYEQLAGLKPTPESPMTIELAFIYARLGRFDDIFAQSPSRYFRRMRIDPRFDGLRTDPRYLQLLAEFQRQNPEPPK